MRKSIEPLHWLIYQLASAGVSKKSIAQFLSINVKSVDLTLNPAKRKDTQELARRSHQKNRTSRLEKQKQYREKNLEREKARVRKYHAENAALVKAAAFSWRESNRARLREQARKYYSGKVLHSALSDRDAAEIRVLYENGVATQQIASRYGVGVKAVTGAVRYAGGAIGSKTRKIALSDTLLGFCSGKPCRAHDESVSFYINTTCIDGLLKAGITKEGWSSRAAKNRCKGRIYKELLKTWHLPSRFHGWCIETCWASLRRPSTAQLEGLERLPGWSEVRAGDSLELQGIVDSWCSPFSLETDSLESRYRCICLALEKGDPSPELKKHLVAVVESFEAFRAWHLETEALQTGQCIGVARGL